MKTIIRTTLAAGALALVAGASSMPANAAPLGQNAASLKNSASQAATNVQWRRHHHGRNLAIGLGAFGAGVIAGSVIANNQGYYYDAPYGYGPSYGYAPAYGYAQAPYGYEQPYGYAQPYGYTYSSNGNQASGYENPADIAK